MAKKDNLIVVPPKKSVIEDVRNPVNLPTPELVRIRVNLPLDIVDYVAEDFRTTDAGVLEIKANVNGQYRTVATYAPGQWNRAFLAQDPPNA